MARSRPPQVTINGIEDVDGLPTTPLTPGSNVSGPACWNRRSLKQLWDAADANFFGETGYHLETAAPLHKEGVLQKWAARYKEENTEIRKKLDKLTPILQNIVNGIEVVGAFAASAASAVFGPAQMCFNAITFVLDAPAKIKHVYDCLAALFAEVGDFLVKFRVLDRIDAKGQLDAELVDNANRLLVAFTRICGIAVRLLKRNRTVLTALATVFLTSDGGVSAALAEFKDLAVAQAQVVGTISLEHVLENESLSRQILAGQHEMTVYFRTLASKDNDEKTRMVIKQRIGDIERKLFLTAELGNLSQPRQLFEPLPGTLEALASAPEYVAWSNVETIGQSVLYLSGEVGTGKSCLVECLRDFLDAKREKMLKQGPSLYVAYHNFTINRSTTRSKNAVTQALKNVALQVACQSTRYTKVLGDELREKDLVNETDTRKVWQSLKMFDFGPPAGSVLYMLFDGLQSEEMKLLLKVISAKSHINSSNFKVCILFAGLPDVIPRANWCTRVEMEKLNKDVLRIYIEQELDSNDCFEDSDEKVRVQRAAFVERLLRNVEGSFHAAKQKVIRMCEALDDDATGAELEAVIDQNLQITFDEQARKSLSTLASSLTAKHLTQCKKILAWTLYGLPSGFVWQVSNLEAVLRLQQKEYTFESLAKKIAKRYSSILALEYGTIKVKPEVENYLLQINEPDAVVNDETARFISLTINIQNATRAEVQKFLLDLNSRLAQDSTIFERTPAVANDRLIQISKVDSLIDVVLHCLKALNEELLEDTEPVLAYAIQFLPWTLHALLQVKDKIPRVQHIRICEELITFLSDPYYIDNGPQFQAFEWVDLTEWWFADKETSRSIIAWLEDEGNLPLLQPQRRRWVKHAATRNHGRADYLQELALALARRWHAACIDHNVEGLKKYCDWLSGYLNHLTVTNSPNVANAQDNEATRRLIQANQDIVSNSLGEQSNNSMKTEDRILVDGLVHNDNSSPSTLSQETLSQETNLAPTDVAGDVTHIVKRVVAVSEWATKMLLNGQQDAAYNYRVGISLFEIGDTEAARQWFAKVEADNSFAWRALIKTADCLRVKAFFSESAETLRRALNLKRPDYQRNELTESEVNVYRQGLKDLARLFDEDLLKTGAAIECFRELLDLTPEDGSSRWFLFRALCKEGQESEAAEMLDLWVTSPKGFGSTHPKDALCIVAKDCDTEQLNCIFTSINDQKLRTKVLDVFSDAVTSPESQAGALARARIMYALATALATSPVATDQTQATQYLEDILGLSLEQHDLWRLYVIVADACRFACLMRFNYLRKQSAALLPDSATSMLEAVRDEMNNYVVKLSTLQSNSWTGLYHYVAALCIIMGRRDLARHVLKEEIAEGVEILSDDTPDNDRWGAEQLARAFSCYHDDVSARIAFSLLDRNRRRQKSRLKEGSHDNIQPVDSGIPEDSADRVCNICRVLVLSHGGYWICRFCADIDFCNTCIEGFRKGDKTYELCSPDHKFVHLYHPDGAEEEIADGIVFVDWQIEYADDGSFTRSGGRLASLNEWLKQIRQVWDLPPPSTDTRAQR